LEGGARVHYVLQEIFVKGLCSLDPTQQLSEEDIRTAIQNAAGTKAVLLLPEEPFEILARKAIEKMSDPCHQAARLVYEELNTLTSTCVRREVSKQFPKLAEAIEEATRAFFEKRIGTGGIDDYESGRLSVGAHQHHSSGFHRRSESTRRGTSAAGKETSKRESAFRTTTTKARRYGDVRKCWRR